MFTKIKLKDKGYDGLRYVTANKKEDFISFYNLKKVRTRWPDKTIEILPLIRKNHTETYEDHGHTGSISSDTYFVQTKVHGIKVLIPIEELEIDLGESKEEKIKKSNPAIERAKEVATENLKLLREVANKRKIKKPKRL